MLHEQPTSEENEKLQSSSVLQPHTPALQKTSLYIVPGVADGPI